MLHLRVISPPDETDRVVELLTGEAGATNLVVLPRTWWRMRRTAA